MESAAQSEKVYNTKSDMLKTDEQYQRTMQDGKASAFVGMFHITDWGISAR